MCMTWSVFTRFTIRYLLLRGLLEMLPSKLGLRGNQYERVTLLKPSHAVELWEAGHPSYVCMYVCMYVCEEKCIRVCIFINISICTYTYMYTYNAYLHTYVYNIYTYICLYW